MKKCSQNIRAGTGQKKNEQHFAAAVSKVLDDKFGRSEDKDEGNHAVLAESNFDTEDFGDCRRDNWNADTHGYDAGPADNAEDGQTSMTLPTASMPIYATYIRLPENPPKSQRE